MKKALIVFISVLVIIGFFALPVMADQHLVRFEGGIGVNPSSRPATRTLDVVGKNGTTVIGTVTVVEGVVNNVRGTPPGGQPWVISDLIAVVKMNGDIDVVGRGLLLAGGNNIGTNGGQSVRARLFCDGVAHNSGLVPLEPNGDFRIDDVLDPIPPAVCNNPVLLIVSGGGAWFAAGIPKLD